MRQKRRELCKRAKAPDDFATAAKLLMPMTFAADDFRAKNSLLAPDNPIEPRLTRSR